MDKKCFRAHVLFFKTELIYFLLLELRQVNHEKKNGKGKLYDKLCTYNLLNENQYYFESYLYIMTRDYQGKRVNPSYRSSK